MENLPTVAPKEPSNLIDYKMYDIELCRTKQIELCNALCEISGRVSEKLDNVHIPSQKDPKLRHEHNADRPNVSWCYGYYNIFGCAAGNIIMYDLYCQMRAAIRDYIGDNSRAWMQCWVNTHSVDDLMAYHNHSYPIHGDVSIYPQNTSTVFYKGKEETHRVQNEVGKLYIGPGKTPHEVVENGPQHEPDAPRITIAFNIIRESDNGSDLSMSFIPI